MKDIDVIKMEKVAKNVIKKQIGYENCNPKVLRVLNYEILKKLKPGRIRYREGKDVEYLIFEDESHIMSSEHWPMFYIELKDKNNVKQILENYFKNNP